MPAKAKLAKKPVAISAAKTTAGLGEVEVALARRDSAAALRAALVWWSETRAPAAADLVDAISQRVSPPAVADEQAFAQLASGKDPLDLGPLLAALPELPASFLPTAAELLAAFPADPRHAAAIARCAIDPITTSSSTYPFWTRSFDAVVASRDVRFVATAKKRLAKPKGDSKFWPKFYAALERVVATLAADKPADIAVPAKLTARVAALPQLAAREVVRALGDPAPKLDGPLLEQAAKHLALGRVAAAIDAMVARWRDVRAPALADAIDRATQLLPSWDLPLAVVRGQPDPWLAAFERGALVAMPQLLQSIVVGDGYGGKHLADRRLAELSTLPDDPRVALRLAELSALFGLSPQRTNYWKTLFEIIARIADVRTAEPLRKSFREFTNKYFDHHRQAKRIVGEFAMSPPAPPALPPDDVTRLAALAHAIDRVAARSPERSLIAAIAAAGDDDAPRLVYADWLGERGHPRGAVIALARKASRTRAEENELIGLRNTPYVYGALDDFGRGEPIRDLPTRLAAKWSLGALTWRALASHPLLALIEHIDVSEVQVPPGIAELVAVARAAPRLERLVGAGPELWRLEDDEVPGFRRVKNDLVRG